MSLALDLLDGEGYGKLQQHKSQLNEPLRLSKKRKELAMWPQQVYNSRARHELLNSLDQYKRSYLGSIHESDLVKITTNSHF